VLFVKKACELVPPDTAPFVQFAGSAQAPSAFACHIPFVICARATLTHTDINTSSAALFPKHLIADLHSHHQSSDHNLSKTLPYREKSWNDNYLTHPRFAMEAMNALALRVTVGRVIITVN
jgi:hypothetical protein